MNAADKKTLKKIDELVSEAHDLLDTLATETRDRFDELSEKAQENERGQALSDLADNLESARDELANAQGSIQSLIEQ